MLTVASLKQKLGLSLGEIGALLGMGIKSMYGYHSEKVENPMGGKSTGIQQRVWFLIEHKELAVKSLLNYWRVEGNSDPDRFVFLRRVARKYLSSVEFAEWEREMETRQSSSAPVTMR